MAMVLLLGVPASVYKNGEKLHFWNQIITILEPVEIESHTVPQNDGQGVYYLEPKRRFGIFYHMDISHTFFLSKNIFFYF